jgi:transposase InsO family protein
MRAHQADFPIALMADVLQVSRSGFYAWRDRPLSARARRDAELVGAIRSSHTSSDGSYGALRVHEDLKEAGFRVGEKRVARLMREHGIVGVTRRRGPTTTTRQPGTPKGPDLVERDFSADGPDQLWVADITYVPTGSGFLYLSVVLDAFSRRVVGWAMAGHLRTELVLAALDMAVAQRQPDGVVHHSDHGSQYTSLAFGARCREAGVRPSLGSVGDCFDNAMCESFFATLECELVDRYRWATKAEARMALFRFIEGWYNPRRRHSALGYDSPERHEQKHREALAASYS